jgi:hypothetical protein
MSRSFASVDSRPMLNGYVCWSGKDVQMDLLTHTVGTHQGRKALEEVIRNIREETGSALPM